MALRLLKERADTAEARAASAVKQISELKASLQVLQFTMYTRPLDAIHLCGATQ